MPARLSCPQPHLSRQFMHPTRVRRVRVIIVRARIAPVRLISAANNTVVTVRGDRSISRWRLRPRRGVVHGETPTVWHAVARLCLCQHPVIKAVLGGAAVVASIFWKVGLGPQIPQVPLAYHEGSCRAGIWQPQLHDDKHTHTPTHTMAPAQPPAAASDSVTPPPPPLPRISHQRAPFEGEPRESSSRRADDAANMTEGAQIAGKVP